MNLLEQCFITVGTQVIRDELLIPVQRPQDTHTFKPRNGLWATIYYGKSDKVCDWLDFLQSHETYKDYFPRKAAVFKLKRDTKICLIQSIDDVKRLSMQYPSLHHKLCYHDQKLLLKKHPINYEKLLDDYDGVYIELSSLPQDMLDIDGEFENFDCSSLILSNTKCIEYYQTIELDVNIDLKFTSKIINEPINIATRNEKFDSMLIQIRELALNRINNSNIPSSKSYEEYWNNLEKYIRQSANAIYYRNENIFNHLDSILMCNGLFPVVVVMKEIIMSEQLREADKNILTKYLK